MNNLIKVSSKLAVLAAATGFCALSQAQTQIPATFRLPATAADASKPGFIWRVHSVGRELANTLARTESQLAGLEGDNIADPSAQGGALGPALPPNPSTAPITFEVDTAINFDQGAGSNGAFTPDEQMPGIPATNGNTDGIAAEVLTWLSLPAGEVIMGVNSDDGFRVSVGGADPSDKFNAINVGEFDGGRGVADTIFRFNIAEAGLYAVRLIWEEGGGGAAVEWFSQDAAGNKTLINDPTGIKAYRAVTTGPTKAYLRTAAPAPNSTTAVPNARIIAEIADGASPISASSARLFLDNTQVQVTPIKSGSVTTLNYQPTSLFAANSQHNVQVVYTEAGNSVTQAWTFRAQNYATVPPSMKVTADTTKPGFIWNMFANSGNQENSNDKTERALGGLQRDVDGNLLPNLADPAAQGGASAPSTAPNPAHAPIRFDVTDVINFDQAAGSNGSFTPDVQMPGIPATDGSTDGVAAEILSFIELPAGLVTFGVNSDDGFRTTIGWDAINSIFAGEFNGGRGAADTIFNVFVQEAGVYPIRTTWEEGGGGANIEYFAFDSSGLRRLINGTGGFKSYRAATTQAPYVKFVSPASVPRLLNAPSSSVTILLADGASPLDLNSITLKIDGKDATITKTREGSNVRVVWAPNTLLIPTDIHTAELSFSATGGTAQTRTWSFRNLKNLVLPAAVATENFDSYPEDTIPTGWTAWNFTSTCTPGRDVTDQTSDSYKDWNLVSTANMVSLDGGSINVAPGQTFNGAPVTEIASGNVLYAESDGRCGTDTAGGQNSGQAQFITSKAFNLSTVTNPVMTISVLYTQNQDSVGTIEYSVDGGTSWLPVVIFLDSVDTGGDIKYFTDGRVDALTTLNGVNADTATWFENGVAKGDKYGAALATPITESLGDYIAPRLNDNQTEGHRIEVFRLPAASLKSDVRLRFAQLGTDSWWFAVDNIAFYNDPNAPTPPDGDKPQITRISQAGGNVTITWTGGGTLESATTLTNPAWTTTGDSDGSYTTAASGTRFFRVKK